MDFLSVIFDLTAYLIFRRSYGCQNKCYAYAYSGKNFLCHRRIPPNGTEAAVDVPAYLGITRDCLFKALVATDTAGGYFVFVISSSQELALKLAAACAGTKPIEMLKQKDLLKLTGYIHGGCLAVGMKKHFPTFVDDRPLHYDTIHISGGKVGFLVELDPRCLEHISAAKYCSLIK